MLAQVHMQNAYYQHKMRNKIYYINTQEYFL